jgi:hypothetical protein
MEHRAFLADLAFQVGLVYLDSEGKWACQAVGVRWAQWVQMAYLVGLEKKGCLASMVFRERWERLETLG